MNGMYDVGVPSSVPQIIPNQIHVLLVDHDDNNDAVITEKFAYFSCEVTIVKLASTALSMLMKGKSQYDLLMVNVDLPSSCGFQLLKDAVKMDIPVIMLTNEDDPIITTRAIEEGAILCVQKPITIELVKYLWQHVLREKLLKAKQNEKLKESMELYKLYDSQIVQNNDVLPRKRKTISQEVSNDNEERNLQDHGVIESGKKKWIEWTPELHEKFLAALRILGKGGCFPKDILELMNVPGLKRMQVASHLQKCRYGDWQLNYKRKYSLGSSELMFDIPPAKSRRFGTMPRMCNISPFSFNVQEQYGNNQVESSLPPNNTLEHIYQVPVTQEHYNGYIPFGYGDTGINSHEQIYQVPDAQQDFNGYIPFGYGDNGNNAGEQINQVPVAQQNFNGYIPFGYGDNGNNAGEQINQVPVAQQNFNAYIPFGYGDNGNNAGEQINQVPVAQQNFNAYIPFGYGDNGNNTGEQINQAPVAEQDFNGYIPFGYGDNGNNAGEQINQVPVAQQDLNGYIPFGYGDNGNNTREQIYQVPVNQQDLNGYIPFGQVDTGNIENIGFSLDDIFTCDAQSGTGMTTVPNQGMNYNGQFHGGTSMTNIPNQGMNYSEEFHAGTSMTTSQNQGMNYNRQFHGDTSMNTFPNQGMNNVQFQGTGADDHEEFYNQIRFMLDTTTNIWSHETSNAGPVNQIFEDGG